MACLNCHQDKLAYNFKALEVLTLHIRAYDGEKYVQALGEVVQLEICEDCLKQFQDSLRFKRYFKKIIPFILMIVLGLLLLQVKTDIDAIKLLASVSLLVGILACVYLFIDNQKLLNQLKEMDQEEARRYCAWLLATIKAPKKSGDNDITYIDIEEAKGKEIKQLCLDYDLLPAIGKQASGIIEKQL